MRQDGSLARNKLGRHPNGDPEDAPFYLSGGTWTKPATAPCDSGVVRQSNLPDNYPGMFQDYLKGVGGACDMFELDDASYWCQPFGRTAAPKYCARHPTAVAFDAADFAGVNTSFSDLRAARVVAWRGSGEWYTWTFNLSSYDAANGNLTFGRGGFQGAEGSDSGGRWYLEGLLELLDAPGEFFFDSTAQKLYYYPNTTVGTPPPTGETLMATQRLEVRSAVMATGSLSAKSVIFHATNFYILLSFWPRRRAPKFSSL